MQSPGTWFGTLIFGLWCSVLHYKHFTRCPGFPYPTARNVKDACIGSALSSVWKQTGTPTLLWATTAVTTYLVCISVLHVTSSTLLQFQTFNSTMTTTVSTTLGWTDITPGTLANWENVNWGVITASLPAISRFPGILSAGLSNNTVYDTLQTSSVVGHATVNATTITSNCGLLPNVTYIQNNNEASAPIGNGNTIVMSAPQPLQKEVAVPMIVATPESHARPAAIDSMGGNASMDIYHVVNLKFHGSFVYTRLVKLWLLQAVVVMDSQVALDISVNPQLWMSSDLAFTVMYIMSLIGLSLQYQYDQWANNQAPIANFTLRPDQLEVAIAKTVAQLIWMAGHMGSESSDGGMQPGEGVALVSEDVVALRLNITLLPLLFATSASVIMLGLALYTTGAFDASHSSRASISNTGVLQFLWLGYYSASVHEALQDVEHPMEDNLRRAGMIDVCFASTTSDEELPMRRLIDNAV
ncbi:hypothetical protein CY34DRAFT_110514 [Suillus luteus UH-Slu-Lm8-n1]|uniref:Uncharacterized protein n=1 Tax=Suillus luteus UH-Slu-Lm8-n1 TaxID=930992 RepID=A0A0D0APE2_9AGAM|nr:hypothetical protein CY34DRAFT_110514 [Suillus luteus UH-Slu-Lm8-n1]